MAATATRISMIQDRLALPSSGFGSHLAQEAPNEAGRLRDTGSRGRSAGRVGLSCLRPASGQGDNKAAAIYGIKTAEGYRNWRLISVNHLTGGKLKQARAQLGNDITIRAFQEGTIPFPDGTIIAALHWKDVPSDENNKVLAMGFPGAGLQSFGGPAVNVQFMVKDSKKYAATGGWGLLTSQTANLATRHCTRRASAARACKDRD
jgi:hypothetical protein